MKHRYLIGFVIGIFFSGLTLAGYVWWNQPAAFKQRLTDQPGKVWGYHFTNIHFAWGAGVLFEIYDAKEVMADLRTQKYKHTTATLYRNGEQIATNVLLTEMDHGAWIKYDLLEGKFCAREEGVWNDLFPVEVHPKNGKPFAILGRLTPSIRNDIRLVDRQVR